MILYILDIKKTMVNYFIISLICLIFSIIYEMFSHQVYSKFMICAFLIPLIGGIILLIINKIKKFNILAINIYHCSIATFTIGSIVQGILEIYGTTNNLTKYYLYIGLGLMIISIIIQFYRKGVENV